MANREDAEIREALDTATEELLAFADEARRAFRESETVRIEALYRRVRERANEARGPARALYEVAEAYLRALARGDQSRDAVSLLRFVEESASCAELIAKAASAAGAAEEEIADLPPEHHEQVSALLRDGVLVASGGRLAVRRALRPVARDLVDPPVLRMWRQVETSRAQVALARLESRTEQARALAGSLGITEGDAQAHLAEHSLTASMTTVEEAPASGARVVYRRAIWLRPPVIERPAEGERASVTTVAATTWEQPAPTDCLARMPKLN